MKQSVLHCRSSTSQRQTGLANATPMLCEDHTCNTCSVVSSSSDLEHAAVACIMKHVYVAAFASLMPCQHQFCAKGLREVKCMTYRMWTRSSRKSKSSTKHNTYHPRWDDAFDSAPYVFLVQVPSLLRHSR